MMTIVLIGANWLGVTLSKESLSIGKQWTKYLTS